MRMILPPSPRPKLRDSIDEPVVFSDRKECGHLLAGLLWVESSKKYLNRIGENVPPGECLHVNRKSLLLFSVFFGRREYCWTESKAETKVDLECRTLLLSQVYSGVAPRSRRWSPCSTRKTHLFRIVTTTEVTDEKHSRNNNSSQPITAWESYDLEGHVEKCVDWCGEVAGKRMCRH